MLQFNIILTGVPNFPEVPPKFRRLPGTLLEQFQKRYSGACVLTENGAALIALERPILTNKLCRQKGTTSLSVERANEVVSVSKTSRQ